MRLVSTVSCHSLRKLARHALDSCKRQSGHPGGRSVGCCYAVGSAFVMVVSSVFPLLRKCSKRKT